MQLIEPLILISSIFVGLLLGALGYTFQESSEGVITAALILMLYAAMLGIPFRRVLEATKNVRFISLSIAINFIFVPLFAWYLSTRFVSEPAMLLGLLMYFAMPCTDWSLVFTSSAKGDVALGTVLVPVNLFLQIVLLPLYVLLFMGSAVPLNFNLLFKTLLLFFLIPLFLAVISRRWGRRSLNQLISRAQTAFLGVALAVMFASQESIFLEKLPELWVILIPLLGFFLCMFILSNLLWRLLKLENKEAVLLNFTTSARNSPIALVIALGAFPTLPLAAAVIAIAPIIEIPILAVEARILRSLI